MLKCKCGHASNTVVKYFDHVKDCNPPIALNGKPAVIMGRLLPYATIASLDGTIRAEWSWCAVSRIVSRGGEFRL